jgi:hypothetical protein
MLTTMRCMVLAALVLANHPGAAAAPITTLFNTGVNASGTLLPPGNGQPDPHYRIISGPGISSPVSAVTYFNGAYAADGPNSRWISSTGSGGSSAGTYVFETTFSLAGFNPASATITVRCGTDDFMDAVSLNGGAVAGDCDAFNPFPTGTFTIASGFNAGVNALRFSVRDGGPPMAFRAEYTSDVQPLSAVPEPASLVLVTAGLAGCLLLRPRTR